MIDDPESSEVAAYLKKILKSSGRKATENHANGSDSTTPRKSSVPDLLMGIDVSDYSRLLALVKRMNTELDWPFVIFIPTLICGCD